MQVKEPKPKIINTVIKLCWHQIRNWLSWHFVNTDCFLSSNYVILVKWLGNKRWTGGVFWRSGYHVQNDTFHGAYANCQTLTKTPADKQICTITKSEPGDKKKRHSDIHSQSTQSGCCVHCVEGLFGCQVSTYCPQYFSSGLSCCSLTKSPFS